MFERFVCSKQRERLVFTFNEIHIVSIKALDLQTELGAQTLGRHKHTHTHTHTHNIFQIFTAAWPTASTRIWKKTALPGLLISEGWKRNKVEWTSTHICFGVGITMVMDNCWVHRKKRTVVNVAGQTEIENRMTTIGLKKNQEARRKQEEERRRRRR